MQEKKILITGNEAIAEAAIQAGCFLYAGYPITPQNELTAYMAKRMRQEKRIFIQAESELAAINMVLGAAVGGFRAMTSSSSPGISLKQEGISYLAGCELPAVIVNIMRGGPGLGNIAPSQSDYFQATKGGGHGDYRNIVLAPASVQEAIELTFQAFELADQYRNPVIILGDGMLGQMMEPAMMKPAKNFQKKPIDKSWALTGAKGRPAKIIRSLYLREGQLEEINLGLQKKYRQIQKDFVRYEVGHLEDSQLVFIAYGSMARIIKSLVVRYRERGEKFGFIRPITLWPFPKDLIRQVAKKVKCMLVIEMSYGQMLEDVELAVMGRSAVEFFGRAGGGIPQEEEIKRAVSAIKKKYRIK